MHLIKKFLSTLLAMIILLCSSITSLAGAINGSHWAINYADFVMALQIIPGTRNNFSPENNLTRAELTLSLARVKLVSFALSPTSTPFTDVPNTHTYAASIKWAYNNNIVYGYPDGTFKPSNSITRADFCVMINRYKNQFNISFPVYNAPFTFTDQHLIPDYAVAAVRALQQAGLISGYENGSFQPNDPITRAEASCVLTKLYEIQYNTENSLNFFVKNTSGTAISGARTFAYENTESYSHLYPSVSNTTNTYGICRIPYLSQSKQYGINVIGNNYKQKVISTLKTPGVHFIFVILDNRTTSYYVYTPITGFTAIGKWPHYGSNCDQACVMHFSRICPQDYFNVTVQQNFGWRYNTNYGNNYLSFHQAIDMAYNAGTPALNCFRNQSVVKESRFIDSCGETIQLMDIGDTGWYATYMHLSTRAVSQYSVIPGKSNIGTVGSTGTDSAHLHFSVSSGTALYALINQPTIIEEFFDPLSLIG